MLQMICINSYTDYCYRESACMIDLVVKLEPLILVKHSLQM